MNLTTKQHHLCAVMWFQMQSPYHFSLNYKQKETYTHKHTNRCMTMFNSFGETMMIHFNENKQIQRKSRTHGVFFLFTMAKLQIGWIRCFYTAITLKLIGKLFIWNLFNLQTLIICPPFHLRVRRFALQMNLIEAFTMQTRQKKIKNKKEKTNWIFHGPKSCWSGFYAFEMALKRSDNPISNANTANYSQWIKNCYESNEFLWLISIRRVADTY